MKDRISRRFFCFSLSFLLTISACGPASGNIPSSTCIPTDQDQYIYRPERLEVKVACLRVTGVVDVVRGDPDGDVLIRLKLDKKYQQFLTEANNDEYGDLVVKLVCYHKVTQAEAIDICASDPDPYRSELPEVGQHIWMEGRYVLNNERSGLAELHPLYRWGPVN